MKPNTYNRGHSFAAPAQSFQVLKTSQTKCRNRKLNKYDPELSTRVQQGESLKNLLFYALHKNQTTLIKTFICEIMRRYPHIEDGMWNQTLLTPKHGIPCRYEKLVQKKTEVEINTFLTQVLTSLLKCSAQSDELHGKTARKRLRTLRDCFVYAARQLAIKQNQPLNH